MSVQDLVAAFLSKLKTKNENARIRAAKELLRYVNGELKENSSGFVEDFLSRFDLRTGNSAIDDLVSSNDMGDRKSGIYIIVCLIESYVNLSDASRTNRVSTTYLLKKAINCSDMSVQELAAKAFAYVSITSKTYAADLVESALSVAYEWFDDSQSSRHAAAVFICRELAFTTPTFFFQRAGKFFDQIFNVIRDPKPILREEAVTALRAALVVTSQRETKQKTKTQWYTMCLTEAESCFREADQLHGTSREDKLHSGLLIFNELLRIANLEGERQRQEAEQLKGAQSDVDIDTQLSARKLSHDLLTSAVHRHVTGHDVIDWLHDSLHPTNFESRTCRRLVTEKYDLMCQLSMGARSSKSAYVQAVLLELLPRLAAFDSGSTFSNKYLEGTLHYILTCLHRDKDKGKAFLALGLMAVVSEEDIKPHIGQIFEGIRSCLQLKDIKKKTFVLDPTVFSCLTLLIQGLKSDPDLERQIRIMLHPMFATGLSPGLTITLREAYKHINSLRVEIQEGLLEQLSRHIMNRQMAPKLAPPPQIELPTGPVHVENETTMVLALKTLGSFHFPRHSLEMFLKYIAHVYLSSEVSSVRLATVQCCTRLLIPFVMLLECSRDQQQHNKLLMMIDEVLAKLLAVAVTDPDSEVRLCVFECLSETKTQLAVHLAQPEMLERIFMGLQDESYDIREAVVCLLGKLGDINPAYVMPTLRRVVIQMLSEMNRSGLSRLQEQGARMMAQLAKNSPKFMKPYMQSLLKTLIPKLRKGNRQLDVVVAVLNAIGELAQVGGPELVERLEELMPILMEFLQDSSSLPKREMALWSLGQVIQNTGYVIEPYKRNPELLDILLRFLKTEQSTSMRRETIRVLGIIGALDPYQHKVFMGSVESAANATSLAASMPETKDSNDPRQEIVQWFNYEKCTLEEFYPAFAIANLMHIVGDPALNEIHKDVILSAINIFKKLEFSRCVTFVDQVMPRFIPVIKDCKRELKGFYFQQLGDLISLVKLHIKPYLQDIFELIRLSWSDDDIGMRQTIIMIVEQTGQALGYEFKPFVPELTPYFMRVLYRDESDNKMVTAKVLKAFQVCILSLEEHLHLILPPIVRIIDATREYPATVRLLAVQTLCIFAETMSLAQFGPRILHTLMRAFDTGIPELRVELMRLLLALVEQMGHGFMVFRPRVEETLNRFKMIETDRRYDILINHIEQVGCVWSPHSRPQRVSRLSTPSTPSETGDNRSKRPFAINLPNLAKMWKSVKDGNLVSKEDWTQWMRDFRVQLLKQSPYSSLRACGMLADVHEPLARDLFNAAFMSVWTELQEDDQNQLSEALQVALEHSDHSDIVQTILNLAEFMDHSEKGPLPVNLDLLGRCAMQTRAYAKALRYRELQVQQQKETLNAKDCEALITLANKLQLSEEAVGVVEYSKEKRITIHTRGRWYEKLHQYEKALELYELQQQSPSENLFENTQHRLRCLEALGDWSKLHSVVRDTWEDAHPTQRQQLAVVAAKGAWGVSDWHAMDEYVSIVNRNTEDGAFLRAVLAVHRDDWRLARQCIDRCRELIDTDLTAMAGESYERAYGAMVTVQRLSELEEAIQFKLMPERRSAIAQIWWSRLQGCRENVEDWQKLLMVRSLVLNPTEMRQAWIKFASLCRRHDKLSMSRRVLHMLVVSHGGSVQAHQQLVECPIDRLDLSFAYAKQLWRENKREEATLRLKQLLEVSLRHLPRSHTDEETQRLVAKCYLKRGQWLEQLPARPVKEQPVHEQAMHFYKTATELDPSWYKAFHSFASCNFAAVLHYKQRVSELIAAPPSAPPQLTPPHASLSAHGSLLATDTEMVLPPLIHSNSLPLSSQSQSPIPSQKEIMEAKMYDHAVASVKSFFRAINLCKENRLQDTLRLLTLWFDYGHQVQVYEALLDGLQTLPVEIWLQVIPQLIARIDTPKHMVARLITQQLTEIGKAHPQALVYPLTVAAKSTNEKRSATAAQLLKQMTQHSRTLVAQARLISEELIRVAILWHELWHEGLEEASRQYFQDRNVKGMFATLEPLHNMIEAGPTTLKEQSFHQTYYRDLCEAKSYCERYKNSGNVKEITQAWDLYYVCFKRISKQLPQLTHLELQYVSPSLLMSRDLDLAVPGTYDPAREVVHIHSLHTSLTVITSKQRPRKVCIKGSDGHDYYFCLKGHEDPRQDERVMQLFGLVNTLLLQEAATCRRNLTIQRYSIVPLSQNSGLIGWVPNTDTLHQLLRDYREKKKILLNIEHRLMQRMAPDIDHLTLMQKVEVFEQALEHTNGDDLQKILWLKSPSSEVWFDRRTNYTRSLATMSMVGYILGLGDRHPSNLMLDRLSGKIVHIDFGDCFEVAMTREKFPEKIPFRLTRMLVNAMEVTGIEGNFKITCERVMRVLRNNRESLLAVLEAFVYDPLINWRLMDQGGGKRTHPPEMCNAMTSDQEPASDFDDVQGMVGGGVVGRADEFVLPTETVSKKAVQVIQRIKDKLDGKDFLSVTNEPCDVSDQVFKLIQQAVSHENLCQCYIGWCPFW